MATRIPAKQLQTRGTLAELKDMLLDRETGWCTDDNILYYNNGGALTPVTKVVVIKENTSRNDIAAIISAGCVPVVKLDLQGTVYLYPVNLRGNDVYTFASPISIGSGNTKDGYYWATVAVNGTWASGFKVDDAVATEKAQREAADAALQNAIDTHAGRTNNPHNVTAGQVGAYTKQETEDRISDAISGEVGGWLGNLTVAEVNALTEHKKGDSATLLDAGTVMPGNATVDVGDDIMWVDSLGVWQPKITDHLHHDETLVGTGSANDPLGVNPETIEDNILRMRYRGGGRLKFWRTNPLPTT